MTRSKAARELIGAMVTCAESGIRLQVTSPVIAMAIEWLRGDDESKGEGNGEPEERSAVYVCER